MTTITITMHDLTPITITYLVPPSGSVSLASSSARESGWCGARCFLMLIMMVMIMIIMMVMIMITIVVVMLMMVVMTIVIIMVMMVTLVMVVTS